MFASISFAVNRSRFMLKFADNPISLNMDALRYCSNSNRSFKLVVFAVVAGDVFKLSNSFVSAITPNRPSNRSERNFSALAFVLSSFAEMRVCRRLFTVAKIIVISFSVIRVQYFLYSGSKPIIAESFFITMQSLEISQFALKFR